MAERDSGTTLKRFLGDSGSVDAQHTVTVPVGGGSIIVRIGSYRPATASGELVNGVNATGLTFTEVVSDGATSSNSDRTMGYMFIAHNVAAGSHTLTLDATYEDDTTLFSWDADVWTGLNLTDAIDVFSSGLVSNNELATSISSGATAALAQATGVAIAMVAGPYVYAWNDVGGSGSPPSGWTLINGSTTQITSELPFQSCYKALASTDPVSATWTIPTGSGRVNVALVAVFMDASGATNLVAECDVDDDIALEAPTEIYVHRAGRPDQVLATRYTGAAITVVGSAGSYKIRVSPAPSGSVEDEEVTFSGFSATYDMGYYTGTVVAAS